MRKIMHIYSQNPNSLGSKALSKKLKCKRIKHHGSKFKGEARKTVINWGAGELPSDVQLCSVVNKPEAILESSNKLSFMNKMSKEVRTPKWTEDIEQAKRWIQKGHAVVCRTVLNGSGGKGIVLADNENELVNAALYTRYVKKKDEYRVHIFKGEIFDIQKKAKRLVENDANWRIRNHNNGFIYKRGGIRVPKQVKEQAIAAFNCTDLDFGAVDVIWNNEAKKAYVLEVNTAPGLEGTTLENYAKIFGERL